MEWIDTGNPAVAVYLREHDSDTMLIFNNLSASAETVNIPAEHQTIYFDLFSGHTQSLGERLTLQPYSYLWLQRRIEK